MHARKLYFQAQYLKYSQEWLVNTKPDVRLFIKPCVFKRIESRALTFSFLAKLCEQLYLLLYIKTAILYLSITQVVNSSKINHRSTERSYHENKTFCSC